LRILSIGMGWFPDDPGGLNRVYLELFNTLQGYGVDIQGMVACDDPSLLPSTGVSCFARRSDPIYRCLHGARRSITSHLQQNPTSVVVSHFAPYVFTALDSINSPLVVHFHGPWADESRIEGAHALSVTTKRFIERRVYRRAARSIVLSRPFAEILSTAYGVDPSTIRIIPGGVDADRFDTGLERLAARKRLNLPAERPIVVSVRRLELRMGLENLVEAMQIVRHWHPDALLLIAGTGKLHAALQQQIVSLGLESHIQLLGFVPDQDLPLLYRAADISVVPTVALEGFGLISIESLAAGTPVLVTPVGGLPETVLDLEPKLILPSSTAESLAAGIAAAFSGKLPLPNQARCQQYVRKHFDWPVIARQVLDVYSEAASL
jgi:glycogen synthase